MRRDRNAHNADYYYWMVKRRRLEYRDKLECIRNKLYCLPTARAEIRVFFSRPDLFTFPYPQSPKFVDCIRITVASIAYGFRYDPMACHRRASCLLAKNLKRQNLAYGPNDRVTKTSSIDDVFSRAEKNNNRHLPLPRPTVAATAGLLRYSIRRRRC